jgi:hypothetical protein
MNDVQRKALKNARWGFVVCVGAAITATMCWMSGNLYLWGVNCTISGIAGTCVLLNYKVAGR